MQKKKDTQLSSDMQQLNELVALIPDERKQIAQKLAAEIVFMAQTLDQLKHDVTERGVVELFKQGKQEFLRESPALKAYNTTIQRYSLLYRQLADLLPKQAVSTDNPLYDFIKEG